MLHVTHHALISRHHLWILSALPFFVAFVCDVWVCALHVLAACSLSLSGIFPPLAQVLQGTSMQQLQQVQVAQSQATPITVNTSNP